MALSPFIVPKREFRRMMEKTCAITTPLFFNSGSEDGGYDPRVYWPLDTHQFDLSGNDKHLVSLSADPAPESVSGRKLSKFSDYGGILGASLHFKNPSGAHYYDAGATGMYFGSITRQLTLYFSFPDYPTESELSLYEEYTVAPATYAARLAGGATSHLSGAVRRLFVRVTDDHEVLATIYDAAGAALMTLDSGILAGYPSNKTYRLILVEAGAFIGLVLDNKWFDRQTRPVLETTTLPTNFVSIGNAGNGHVDNVVVTEDITFASGQIDPAYPTDDFESDVAEPVRNTDGHLVSSLDGVDNIYEQIEVPCHATHIFGGGQRSAIENLKGFVEGVKADVMFVIPRLLDNGDRVVMTPSSFVEFENSRYEITGIQNAGGHDHHYQVFGRLTQ